MHRLFGLLVGAAALAVSALPANAVIIGPGFGVNPTSAQGAFSNDPNGPLVGGLFFDQYLFQLVGGPTFVSVATASNTFADGNGITGPFGIQNFTAAIYQIVGGVDTLPGVPNGGLDILKFGPQSATLCASGLCQQLDGNGILGPGNYYLAVAGNAGTLAGYGGNLSVFEVATPLPAAVWLFGGVLGGAGVIQQIAKRRRQRLALA